MIPHMTPSAITKALESGDEIFDNGYECFYTALAKSDSLNEALELANKWGYNAAELNESWFKALADAKETFGFGDQ